MIPEQMAAAMAELDIDSSDEEQNKVESSCETKQGDTNATSHSNAESYLLYLVQPNLHGKPQRLPSLKVLWIRIFSYSGPTEKETVSFRCLCKLFSKALKPLPCWTSYPHPKYSSLGALFGRFTALAESNSTNIPKVLLIENGVHKIESCQNKYGNDRNYVNIDISISITGESREHCIVIGGLRMGEYRRRTINVQDLTLRESMGNGVLGLKSASVHLDNVSVEKSECNGVQVSGTKRNSMKNCNVSHSQWNGLRVMSGGLMKIDGNNTTIHYNCTNGDNDCYGLDASSSISSIHLASSLSIETISKNNGGGGNHGGRGTIKTITNNKERKKR
jgi:hypothetical protein